MKKITLLLFICCFTTNMIASISNKSENLSNKNVNQIEENIRPKYRIGFDAPQISHRQLLLTIDENTTDGIDWGFDGGIPEVFADDMYWLINDNKYVIQATNTLSIDKEIQLGIVTTLGGAINIKIDSLENPIPGLTVGLKDNVLNIVHNLEESDYQVTLPAGEYQNRFSIIFYDSTSPEEDDETKPIEDENSGNGDENNDRNNRRFNKQKKLKIHVNNGQNVLILNNKNLLKLHEVLLFDIHGQRVKSWTKNLNSKKVILPIQVKRGFYFVIVQTKKRTISKRVLVNY